MLREAAPVYEHPLGFWILTGYEDVFWLLRAGLSVEDRNMADGPLTQLREQMRGDDQPARADAQDEDGARGTTLHSTRQPAQPDRGRASSQRRYRAAPAT